MAKARTTRSTLPKKREPEDEEHDMSPISKKSKAELRRQSISRAKEWAAERKRKGADAADDDARGEDDVKKSKSTAVAVSSDDEARDVIDKLPSIPARRSNRRRGNSKVVAAALAADHNTDDDATEATDATVPLVDEESTTTRRSSRRRTISAKAAAAPPKTVTKKAPATVRRSRRKTVVPAPVEEVEAPEVKVEEPELKEEAEEVNEEVQVKEAEEVVAEEEVAVEEEETAVSEDTEEAKIESTQEDTKEGEQKVETNKEEKDVAEQKTSMSSILLSLAPVFFQGLLIQWTLTFAIMMTFFFDWWVFEFKPIDEVDMTSQRESCTILGLWLVTIVGYLIAFGSQSRAGWILTGAALTMVSFSTKLVNTSVASLPIRSFSGFDINVPDLLLVLCVVGCAVVLKQPKVTELEQPQSANKERENVEVSQGKSTAEKEEDEVPATGPQSLIGQRVAVEKEGETQFGTVKEYNSETVEWLVHYDNEFQTEEELNRVQLGSAFKLYSKNLTDNLKAMWRAGEL